MKELADVLAVGGSKAERIAAQKNFLKKRSEIWKAIQEGRFPARYTSTNRRKFVGAPRRTAIRCRIIELDWSESTTLGPLTLTATPARHFSGRGLTNGYHTLWASWSVAGPRHCVFHSGDTGPFSGFAAIGTAHGPFDLTFTKIGACGETWPDIHLTPEPAVDAHAKVQGRVLLPIHWGTFNLAFHAWDEPAERVVAASSATGTQLIMPKPGESVEPATVRPVLPWWRAVREARP